MGYRDWPRRLVTPFHQLLNDDDLAVMAEDAAAQSSADASLPNALNKDDVRLDAQTACAIAHGRGAGMSLLRLFALVLDEGIPSRVERERMLAERLQDDAGDTT